MRFLAPIILVGAILASQAVFAASAEPSWKGLACVNTAAMRRAARTVRAGRAPVCDPSIRPSRTPRSSSASSSSASSLPAGTRVGVVCPDEGALRRATRLLASGQPAACDPDATPFYGPNLLSSSPTSSSSVAPSVIYDQGETDIRSQFLLLGETGPVIGAAALFIEEEPLRVTSITVNLISDVQSIQSLLIYDDDRRYLGRATLDTSSTFTNRSYRLPLSPDVFTVGKREDRKIYFRPQLSPWSAGGQSGLVAQISNVTVKGNGEWSSRTYTKQSSGSDPFPEFTASRSAITGVKNALQAEGALVGGSNQRLASFTFEGRKTDSTAQINLTDLTFQIEQTGGVSLSNVRLQTSGLPDGLSCTTTSSTVTCNAIPALLGSLTDAPRTILLYGDIQTSGSLTASLRLSLNSSGSPLEAGSVSWTDGTTDFDWVALGSPVVTGTRWRY